MCIHVYPFAQKKQQYLERLRLVAEGKQGGSQKGLPDRPKGRNVNQSLLHLDAPREHSLSPTWRQLSTYV